MLALLLLSLAASATAVKQEWHPNVDNTLLSHSRRNNPLNVMSVSSGAPVSICHANVSINQLLIRNPFFLDLQTAMDRERTVGRPIHVKGAGAFGYFEVTHDISHVCKAKFLNKIGKRTPVVARFSSGIAERGGSELLREVRGFSTRFYTEDGNFDLPGVAAPMFAISNPSYYTKFIYAIRKHPSIYLYDPKVLWEVILEHPESLNMFLWMFSDNGIPENYRRMRGYNVHSLQVENEVGEQSWLRWHITPELGFKHMDDKKAAEIAVTDPDHFTRDLFDSIKKGNFPCYTVSVQMATEDHIRECGYSKIFDITRILPKKEFPLHPVGRMCLNQNPKNYQAEIENLCFSPGNLVNGILGSPDRAYQARLFAYNDAQLVRSGPNYKQIHVNAPLNHPNYNPSKPYKRVNYETNYKKGLIKIIEEESYNRDQCTEFYEELSCDEKTRLVDNLKAGLSIVSKEVFKKVIELLLTVHPDLARRVAKDFKVTA